MITDLLQLSLDERIQLVEDLWDSIATAGKRCLSRKHKS